MISNKGEWLVYIPDVPEATLRRQSVIPAHVEAMKEDPKDFWIMGGFTVTEHTQHEEDLSPTGSAVIVYASSRDEVMNRLRLDVMTKEKVWDIEKAQIWPYKSVVRKPL